MLKKPAFKYWGFGLKILSEIEFPELLLYQFEAPDVTISFGSMPPVAPTETIVENRFFKYILSKTSAYFFVNESANYLSQNGTTIIVEPQNEITDMRDMRLFILSFPIPALLWWRGLVPMHCSAIVRNNGLVCISGDSGTGKSTSVAALAKRSYHIFSDDVIVVNPSLKANSSYALLKLWEDAQQKLSDDNFNDRSLAIKSGRGKFGISFHQSFDRQSYLVKKIIMLKKGDVSTICISKLTKPEAFFELRKQVYRRIFVHTEELQALAFRTVTSLVNEAVVYQITRPLICDINTLANEIENLIKLDEI